MPPTFAKALAGDTHAIPATVGLQGHIAAIGLDNIFQLFDFASLTGKLLVEAEGNGGVFYFKKGVFINGALKISQRRIGAILLESGLITEIQLLECLHLHDLGEQRQPLGEILTDKGYVVPQQLDDSLLLQIKESFFTALSWRRGTFAYYPDEQPTQEAPRLQERIDHLLLEGMVYLDSLGDT